MNLWPMGNSIGNFLRKIGMKYGEVLSYKDAEKAKALIGKEVIFSDSFFKINEKTEVCIKGILRDIDLRNEDYIFCTENDYYYLFIREVIEEKPTYRPYKDCEEMIADFKKRYNSYGGWTGKENPMYCPLIWVRNKNTSSKDFVTDNNLITNIIDKGVYILGQYRSVKDLFDDFTYLDGSPVGVADEN